MLFVNYYKDSSSNVAEKHIFLECKLFWCVLECCNFVFLKPHVLFLFETGGTKPRKAKLGASE